jgi:hypothetical protein
LAKKNKRTHKSREQFDYDPPYEPEEVVEQPKVKYKTKLVYLIDQDEVNALIDASNAPYVEPEKPVVNLNYESYSQEEVNDLIDGIYHPRKSKKKK